MNYGTGSELLVGLSAGLGQAWLYHIPLADEDGSEMSNLPTL